MEIRSSSIWTVEIKADLWYVKSARWSNGTRMSLVDTEFLGKESSYKNWRSNFIYLTNCLSWSAFEAVNPVPSSSIATRRNQSNTLAQGPINALSTLTCQVHDANLAFLTHALPSSFSTQRSIQKCLIKNWVPAWCLPQFVTILLL